MLRVLLGILAIQILQVLVLGPHSYWHSDAQLFFLPAFTELKHQMSQGQWPLLTQRSWMCSNLVGEYQLGLLALWTPLSAVVATSIFDSPLWQALSFMQLQFLVANSGFFCWARCCGVRERDAWVSTLFHAFAGWNLVYAGNWWNAYVTYAWIPWSLACLEAYLRGGRRLWLLGLWWSVFTSITAGYPFSTIWLALALVVRWLAGGDRERLLRSFGVAVSAGLAFLPTLEALMSCYSYSMRRFPEHLMQFKMCLTPHNLLGILNPALPTLYSDEPGMRNSLDMLGMALPLMVVLVGLRSRERFYWWLLAVVTLGLAFVPCPPPLRWSQRWIPYFQLTLCLLAGLSLPRVVKAEGKILLAALGAALAVWLWWPTAINAPEIHNQGLAVVVAALIGWLAWFLVERWRRGAGLGAASLVSGLLVLLWVPNPMVPTVSSIGSQITSGFPYESSRRYLSIASHRDSKSADLQWSRLGNLGLSAGLETINGYSPLTHSGLSRLLGMSPYGTLEERRTQAVCQVFAGPGDILEFLGVDGLSLAQGDHWHYLPDLLRLGWQPVHQSPQALVLHKAAQARPIVRGVRRARRVSNEREALLALVDHKPGQFVATVEMAGGSADELSFADVTVGRSGGSETSSWAELSVAGDGPGLVTFLRPYWPGFRLYWNGRLVPVSICLGCLPGAILPAGESGRLELRYEPDWMAHAPYWALASVLLLAVSFGARARSPRRLA